MRPIAALLLPLLALLAAQPLAAQEIAYDDVVAEAPVAAVHLAVQVVAEAQSQGPSDKGAERFLAVAPARAPQGIATYGPFRVIDGARAAMVGITDGATPRQFAAMLHDYPGIGAIEMITCPGTDDDRANLRLGLMFRQAGIATHVPDGGFVGSGAVELFLAGVSRSAEPAALFAVHSWEDDGGLQPGDYAADAPKNRAYIDYYEAVGMSAAEAQAFYAMTNSVPFSSAKWLSRAEMAQWVRLDAQRPLPPVLSAPTRLAVLDSAVGLQ